MSDSTPPFDGLTPDRVVTAVESLGLLSDLRIFPLNSYENRVYQVGIDEAEPVIAKFYRPQRWSSEQIQEEHDFTQELADLEIPVVPPMRMQERSLHQFEQYRFALYPRRGGMAPQFDDYDQLQMIGRTLGRIHLVGSQRNFQHRHSLSIDGFAETSVDFLLSHDFIPSDLRRSYESLCQDLLPRMRQKWELAGDFRKLRLHGDCHVGNILWRDDTPFFVDFDDCMMGPAVQDLWLFLSGSRQEQQIQLSEILEGYSDFSNFDPAELHLVEVLRSVRIIHYSAWLARRWNDPAFPHHFPWFNTPRYWSEHILELREQLAAIDEQPLALF